jgi:hypothetical protein
MLDWVADPNAWVEMVNICMRKKRQPVRLRKDLHDEQR